MRQSLAVQLFERSYVAHSVKPSRSKSDYGQLQYRDYEPAFLDDLLKFVEAPCFVFPDFEPCFLEGDVLDFINREEFSYVRLRVTKWFDEPPTVYLDNGDRVQIEHYTVPEIEDGTSQLQPFVILKFEDEDEARRVLESRAEMYILGLEIQDEIEARLDGIRFFHGRDDHWAEHFGNL